MTQLVLSLFPGIGLLDIAFELEGFTVVRGPDVLWGGDIRTFHPPAGRFDGIIGGPPCQSFSSLVHLVRANGHEPRFGNLIPEFERCVAEAQPDWFLMENAPQAPVPVVDGYGIHSFLLNNAWLLGEDGLGQEQMRLRRFCFGTRGREAPSLMRWIDLAALLLPEASPTLTQWTPNNSEERKRRKPVLGNGQEVPVAIGGSGKAKATLKRTVTSNVGGFTDGSKNPKTLHEAITGGHDKPPSVRDKAVAGSDGGKSCRMRRYKLPDACRLQGLPENFLKDSPFTAEGKLKAVANGVPRPMGRAIARAVREAIA